MGFNKLDLIGFEIFLEFILFEQFQSLIGVIYLNLRNDLIWNKSNYQRKIFQYTKSDEK